MADISMNVDLREAKKGLALIALQTPEAVSLAINRTIDSAATELSRRIMSIYSVKAKDVKRFVKVNKSNKNTLTGTIKVLGKKSVTAYYFKHSNVGGEIKIDVMKKQKKTLKGFIKKELTTPLVFERVGNNAINIVNAPGVKGMALEIIKEMDAFIKEKFNIRLEHELNRIKK